MSSGGPGTTRVVFSFVLNGEQWHWPVEGDDSIRAFREILIRAEIAYEVRNG